MNYSALIQNRKSVREFTEQQVSRSCLEALKNYYEAKVRRLIPEIKTELLILGTGARADLEGAAGYNRFLVGSPQYLVLLSEQHEHRHMNAGYIMEDLILKLTELELDSCWLTFTDSDAVKSSLGIQSPLDVVAIAAFGHGKKTVKRMRLNIFSMSNVDIRAKHRYMEPKRSVRELVFADTWENSNDLIDHIGFYDDMLWEALYAASLSPSYLNRQAYGFLLRDGRIHLVSRPDACNTQIDGDLSLGVVLLHFTAVAEGWVGKLNWKLGGAAEALQLPKDHRLIATAAL